ncbi:hypothetical protein [Phyllobacterium sp. YR531]|uniref:hypothetical protein n=1 Tax=Phyllobacterium sp. YR531 TaxID=1144343 RepID=UPI0012F6F136|nr:hypothetical protein [Phyllobacterium sp. YR531]
MSIANELLFVGDSFAVPSETLDKTVGEIRQRFPDNPSVTQAATSGRALAVNQWKAEGRTKEFVTPVVTAAAAAQSGQRSWQSVTAVARDQLNTIPVAGRAPLVVESDIRQRVSMLVHYGPQDAAYSAAIEAAQTERLVESPVREIDAVFASEGAPAAAARLREIIENSSPDTASNILEKSYGTLEKIGAALHSELLKTPASDRSIPLTSMATAPETKNESRKDRDFVNPITYTSVLDDLGAVATRVGNPAEKYRNIDRLAGIVADSIPTDEQFGYDSRDGRPRGYETAFRSVVEQGSGSALPLAVARALKERNPEDKRADAIISNTGVGIESLRKQAVADAADMEKQSRPLIMLAKEWSGLMTQGEFASAMEKYLQANPDQQAAVEKANLQIARDRDALWSATTPIDAFNGSLNGSKGFEVVRRARDDTSNRDILNFVLANEGVAMSPTVPPWWTPRAGLDLAKPVFQNDKVLTALKNSPDYITTAFANSGQIIQKARIGGAVLAGLHASDMFKAGSDFFSRTYAGMFALSGVNHSVEYAATNRGVDLGKNQVWSGYKNAFGVVFAGLDTSYAIESFIDGKPIAGAAFAGSAVSGMIAFSHPIAGAVIQLASALIYNVFGESEKRDFEKYSKQLLGFAGLKPEVVEQFSQFNANGYGVGQVFGTLAKTFAHIAPQDMMSYLESLPDDKRESLIRNARLVARDDYGKPKLTAESDLDVIPGARTRMEGLNGPGRTPENPTRAINPTPASIYGVALWASENGYKIPGLNIDLAPYHGN